MGPELDDGWGDGEGTLANIVGSGKYESTPPHREVTSLEEKCSEESSVLSYFKFVTYPILGNLPTYFQKKIEKKLGQKTYDAWAASLTSMFVNLVSYGTAAIIIGTKYRPVTVTSPEWVLPTLLGLILGGMVLENAMRTAFFKDHGCGSLVGKLLFGIPSAIMEYKGNKRGGKRKELERIQEEEANKPTKLELFKELTDLEQDKLTPKLESIAKLGEKLLNRQTDNEVTKGILDMYSPYVEEYIEKAGEYAKDYRSSTSHLQSFNIQEIKKEIKILRENVKKGQKYYKKALQEKEGTLKNIKTIKENREEIEAKLWETQATLQSFHTSIINVETGTDKEQAMKEIQSTVSTLGKALDQNFGKVEEEILEEKVSVG